MCAPALDSTLLALLLIVKVSGAQQVVRKISMRNQEVEP